MKLEGLLAVQMVATHNLATEFMRRTALIGKGLTIDEIDSNNRATGLLQTFVAGSALPV